VRKCFIIGWMFSAAVMALYAGGAVSVVRTDPRTGRLVRTVVRPHPAPPVTPAPALSATVDQIAQQNQIPAQLIHSVIQVESNYDPNAVSPKGALGLMQLIPSTARRFGVSNALDPADNIQGGARYLKYLMELYQGDEALALAAYNAGEGAVARYGGIPPFPETQNYVAAVERRRQNPAPKETSTAPAAVQSNETPTAEAYNPIRAVKDTSGRIYYTSQ